MRCYYDFYQGMNYPKYIEVIPFEKSNISPTSKDFVKEFVKDLNILVNCKDGLYKLVCETSLEGIFILQNMRTREYTTSFLYIDDVMVVNMDTIMINLNTKRRSKVIFSMIELETWYQNYLLKEASKI